jgi:hypothetical protein
MSKTLVLTALLLSFAQASWGQSSAAFKLETGGDSLVWTHGLKPAKGDSAMIKLQKAKCTLAQYANCPVLMLTELGTGFLAADGSVVVTTLHTFKNYLKARWQIDTNLNNMEIPLLISSDGGQVIFGNSADDRAQLTVQKSGADLLTSDQLLDFPDQDIAVIKLSRAIGNPLKFASASLHVGDGVSANGYTLDDDMTAILKQGVILNKPKTSICAFATQSWMALNVASYQTDSGFSGAPILNEQHEVVGMHEGLCPDPSGPYTYFLPIAKIIPLL